MPPLSPTTLCKTIFWECTLAHPPSSDTAFSTPTCAESADTWVTGTGNGAERTLTTLLPKFHSVNPHRCQIYNTDATPQVSIHLTHHSVTEWPLVQTSLRLSTHPAISVTFRPPSSSQWVKFDSCCQLVAVVGAVLALDSPAGGGSSSISSGSLDVFVLHHPWGKLRLCLLETSSCAAVDTMHLQTVRGWVRSAEWQQSPSIFFKLVWHLWMWFTETSQTIYTTRALPPKLLELYHQTPCYLPCPEHTHTHACMHHTHSLIAMCLFFLDFCVVYFVHFEHRSNKITAGTSDRLLILSLVIFWF